ncbi:hypothetical protein IQ268_23290 [Oculatella sp. LEGE 06141]|uniref:hypothetical protein n=1 Tax=Oculatella sp. LEGE 06141 TaxID=1828648 RepID=UPI0018827D27|nr:hypothetical protein [Oculatella sp. LEGE 06141]MBE9181490.1 hypothetical protein [Oculatella sp. LEGE 06141]
MVFLACASSKALPILSLNYTVKFKRKCGGSILSRGAFEPGRSLQQQGKSALNDRAIYQSTYQST